MLRNYKTPHKIIHWQDNYSEAKGWIVIQNIVNGISGGGLFMSTHATLEEVKDLAYTMCLKNTLQEIPIGGGKGGIRFDHNHSEALNVVSRFLKDNEDIIKNDWCTGGDLNTTTSMITKILKEATGLSSPFSCLLNMLQKRLNIQPNLEKFHRCLHFPLNSYWKVEDLITGYSIIETIIAILERQGKKIQRHNVVIQGFGKVGKAASCFIKDYFNIVGICEKDWFLYDNKGIDVDQLMIDQHVKTFSSKFKVIYRNTSEGSEDFLIRFLQNVEADIFCPCAQRYVITKPILDCLLQYTFRNRNPSERYIISGANNVFEKSIFLEANIDDKFIVIPEWISNCGNAILFIEAMKFSQEVDENWVNFIFSKVKFQIRQFIAKTSQPFIQSSFYSSCHRLAEAIALPENLS